VIVPETEAVASVVDVIDAVVVDVLVVVLGAVVVVVDAVVVDVLVVVLGAVVVVVDATVVDVLVVVLGALVVVGDSEAMATGTSTVASPQAPDSSRVRTLLSAGSTDSPQRYFTATQRCR